MFDLRNVLSEKDKTKIKNYVFTYATSENHFIGIDEWLEHWAKNKIKLYKLLGNSFIYKTPYQYDKPAEELYSQLRSLVQENEFCNNYEEWRSYIYYTKHLVTFNEFDNLGQMLYYDMLVADKITRTIKFKLNGAPRELQIQGGAKPMKALSKVIDYFYNSEEFNPGHKYLSKADFEEFRIKHSQILNDKIVKGQLVFSIHPLDFITMSDNSLNWRSCMNWTEDNGLGGCYHAGTIEMMNSNNVICCYIESKEPYYFGKNDEKSEDFAWSNKRWRQLFYITKDIIVGGKSYPYRSEELTKTILTKLRELANDNLKWRYNFGPERYKDMKYIQSAYTMNRARDYLQSGNVKKHNILFDTKGMYNDMLNDQETKYWCVRNKVNHTKIISYSGKANCLCCGESIIARSDYEDEYNERYENVGSSICPDCREKFRCCDCDKADPHNKMFTYIDGKGIKKQVCEKCWTDHFYICPICGEPMRIHEQPYFFVPKYEDHYNIYDYRQRSDFFPWNWSPYEGKAAVDNNAFETMRPVFMHESCANKEGFKNDSYTSYNWRYNFKIAPYDKREDYTRCYLENLKRPEHTENIKVRSILDKGFEDQTWAR